MKKTITYLLSVFILSISCSRDDASTNENITPPTGMPKLVKTKATGGTNETYYNYNGNKLASITNNNNLQKVEVVYSGDLITRIYVTYPDGDPRLYVDYTYDNNNRLIQKDEVNFAGGSSDRREILTYNSENTILLVGYIKNASSGVFNYFDKSLLHLNANKDPFKIESDFNESNNTYDDVENIVYDTKNNPYKNIVGLDKIRYYSYTYSLNLNHIINNQISYQNSATGLPTINYAYTYNSDGYPITRTSSSSTSELNYFYQ